MSVGVSVSMGGQKSERGWQWERVSQQECGGQREQRGSGSDGAAGARGQWERRGSGSDRQEEMGYNIKGPKLATCD